MLGDNKNRDKGNAFNVSQSWNSAEGSIVTVTECKMRKEIEIILGAYKSLVHGITCQSFEFD